MLKQLIFGTLSFCMALTANAAVRNDIKQIGPHEPIFTFEKNENPQNIMVVYTELDKDCHFIADKDGQGQPLLDYYWLMDGKSYKPVHPMIKSGMKKRMELEANGKAQSKSADGSFLVRINDLKELKTDLKDFSVQVKAERNKSQACDVEALVKLGPSDHERVLRLQTIASKAEKTALPPFRKLESITLIGKDVKTGELVKRTYQGRS
jgi:hypothetical protein